MNSKHYQSLERMFHDAPIQKLLSGGQMHVADGKSTYSLSVNEEYFHAADALHGAVYFKLLDDAAYFAAASKESTYFLLTKSYNIEFIRPVEVDQLIATGELVSQEQNVFIAKSTITNSAGKIVATGEGIFVRSKKLLSEQQGYTA